MIFYLKNLIKNLDILQYYQLITNNITGNLYALEKEKILWVFLNELDQIFCWNPLLNIVLYYYNFCLNLLFGLMNALILEIYCFLY